MASSPASVGPRPRVYVTGFLVFCAAVGLIGSRSYILQRTALAAAWRDQLHEMAEVKAGQVAAWRAERLGDAAVAVADTPLMPAVQQVLRGAEPGDGHHRVVAWMDAMRANYQYANIVLVDPEGRTRLSSGSLFGTTTQYAALARDAASTDEVVLREVPGPPSFARSHLAVIAGLRDDHGNVLGTLILGVDPTVSLYRSILAWPTSRTGQLVLARQDGGALRYLSPVRRVSAAPMQLTEPLEARSTAIVRAVGDDRGVEGADAAGVPVVASASRIPRSTWVVVATLDRDEAYAPLGETAIRLLGIGGLLVLLCGTGVGLAWRHQRSTFALQRREAEAERRALRGHYEYLARFGNDAIILLDGDGMIVEVNDRAVESFGYSREEFQSMHVSQLRGEDSVGDFAPTWEAVKQNKSLVFETTDRRKDGSLFPVEVSVRLMEIEGRPFCQSILRDITERRRSDQQIRRLNRLYAVLSGCSQAIVDSRTEAELFDRVCRIAADRGGFPVALIALVDPDTQAIVPVARAGESAGYLDGIVVSATDGPFGQRGVGRCIRERRPVIQNDIPGDPAMAPWQAEAARHGLRSSIALPLRRLGKEVGVLGLYAGELGFFDAAEAQLAEEVAESVSFALDGLAQELRRQQAESDLRASRDRLERVLDAIDEGYWDWRPAVGDAHLSARYHTMLGYLPGELPFGEDAWLERTHPQDTSMVTAAFRRFIETRQETFSAEYRMRCKSGAYIWVRSRAKVAERDGTGRPTRLVGTHTDITERKKLEDQFLQAQKLESVGRLAGGIAHDFNNLLTVINGYSEVVLGALGAGDPNWAHVDAILQAGGRAAALTHQLLAFSRKQATQPCVLRLNEVVQEFEPLLRRLVGEDVTLLLRLEATADRVLADPSQLHQVIMNLVVNARDAMPSGGRVVIQTTDALATGDEAPEILPGPYVVLSVTDTGTGMDEDTLALVFEPFFTTKARGKGTGLGLSMVYGVVRQGGGFVRADSRPGQGTAFTIYWPRTAGEALPTVARGGPRRLPGSETVLVAEDQAAVRTLAVDVLRSLGYSVLSAVDGNDALRLADEHEGPIHLLLTDVVMPGLDGKGLATRLMARRPDIKVIYSSGYTDDTLAVREILEAGVAYLPKPFTADLLGAKVREVLGPAGGRAPAAPAPLGDRHLVLVADDDENVRRLLADCLDANIRVLEAADGEEAVEIVRREPDLGLLITDLFMPKQEGIETIQAVRDLRPGLPIIAISGAFGGQFLSAAERLGVAATLPKPVALDVFRRTVADVLSGAVRAD